MKRIIIKLSILLLTCSLCIGETTDQLSRHGITWTFDGQYTYGEFANGDYWVVGPVTIVSISPGSTEINGRTMNGSMINPSDQGMMQGYDSSMWGGGYYSASLNVALDVSTLNPLVVANGSSLISTISVTAADSRPQLTDAAVLTVLSTSPSAGSFRPSYYETDKTILFNVSDLDYTKLPNLTAPASAPAITAVESYLERVWLDHVGNHMGREIHPSNNMPDYGRDMTLQTGSLMLSLLLDYTNAEKETALINITQFGIDLYAIFDDGGMWNNNGGHNMGRKLPILLAGLVLDDSDMLAVGQSQMRFHEDQQTWIVTQADVGRPLYDGDGRPREEYIQADVGIAEWGEKHYTSPSRDGRNYDAYYRDINGLATLSHVLTANILGLRDEWNWEPLFLYFDRYVPWARSMGDSPSTTFHMDMWDLYRNWNNISPVSDAGSDQTVTDSDSSGYESVTLDGSGSSDSDGTITSYVWTENSTQIATGVSPTVSLSVGTHTITLTVTDDDSSTDTDTVEITVEAANVLPVADAGSDQTVTDTDLSGYESITLDGSGSSDSDGTIVSYVWEENSTQIATGVSPTISLSVGVHTIALTVADDDSETDTDTVVITVEAGNIPPVADAGSDQTVTDTDDSGYESVTLDGSGSSDSDGTIVSYVWEENSTQIATGVSPTVSLSVGVHTIDLTVTDNDNDTDTETVVITVEAAPATNQIAFDASSSAGAQGTATLSWTHTIGSGSDRMLSVGLGLQDDSATDIDIVSVTYDGVAMTEAPNSRSTLGSGTKVQTASYYMLDSDLPASGSYTVSVTYAGAINYMTGGAVSLENVGQLAPEAVVATGGYGDTISSSITTLTDGAWVVDVVSIKAGWGQSWLPTGAGMTERWDKCTGSNTSASSTRPVATAGAVTLSWDYSSSANIIAHSLVAFAPVTASPPVADAGTDQNVTDTNGSGWASVTLDGTGSSDSDGTITSYVWEENSTQIATGSQPAITLDVGEHTIDLSVTDDDSNTDTDSVDVTVYSRTLTGAYSWPENILPIQTGTFTVEFDLAANLSNVDCVVGLAYGAAAWWNQLACIVRLNDSGYIDVRDGGGYTNETVVSYAANDSFHVEMLVDVPNAMYSVYVTPAGGSRTLIADDYDFRTEQSSITSIDHWTLNDTNDESAHTVSNLTITD